MDSESNVFEFVFDTRIQSLIAIKKAAYRFGQDFSIELSQLDTDLVNVRLTPLRRVGFTLSPDWFPNEVIDQELREHIAEQTRTVRELILAQALSGLALVDEVGESADFRDDPLGIAIPDRKQGSQ